MLRNDLHHEKMLKALQEIAILSNDSYAQQRIKGLGISPSKVGQPMKESEVSIRHKKK